MTLAQGEITERRFRYVSLLPTYAPPLVVLQLLFLAIKSENLETMLPVAVTLRSVIIGQRTACISHGRRAD